MHIVDSYFRRRLALLTECLAVSGQGADAMMVMMRELYEKYLMISG